jgi:tetratricopeptide (TPR) repeat protein
LDYGILDCNALLFRAKALTGHMSRLDGSAMKKSFFVLTLALYFLAGLAGAEAAQRRGAGGGAKGANRQAVGGKDSSATPGDLETNALEFEKKGDWLKASVAYRQAAIRARLNGEYQKAIQYGQKALQMGEAAKDPLPQAAALLQLSYVYNQIRQRDKSKEALEKGVEIAKKIPSGNRKQMIESSLYRELGRIFLEQGEADKAIEAISYALQGQESQLALVKRRGQANAPGIRKIAHNTAQTLQRLGKAHSIKGDSAEAIKVYEKSLLIIEEFKLKSGTQEMVYRLLAGSIWKGRILPAPRRARLALLDWPNRSNTRVWSGKLAN